MKLIIASRIHKDVDAGPIQLKPPPNKKPFEQQNLLYTVLPSLAMAVPMLLGFYLMNRGRSGTAAGKGYMSLGIVTAIGSAIIGAIASAANLHRRNENRRYNEHLRKRSYREYLGYLERSFKEHVNYAENVIRNEYPAFSELANIKFDSQYKSRGTVTCLNENPLGDLTIHLGYGDKSYLLPIKYDNDYQFTEDTLRTEMNELIKKYSVLRRIPVCVTLNGGESLSVIANMLSDYYGIFIMLVGKICLTYSPKNVKVGFDLKSNLYNRASAVIKFLPHIVDINEFDESVELGEMFLIVFTDREASAFAENFDKNFGKNNINVITIFLGADGGDHLLHDTGSGVFYVNKDNERTALVLDLIGQSEFEAILRTCCRLRNFDDTDDYDFPRLVPILDLLNINGSRDIIKAWERDDAIYDLSVPIGFGRNHSIVSLNLHERGDGPHGLIAGMTGSGKSELLMSMILTIAVKYPPWYAAFFLIDYKGGGMAASMEKLPHVLGSISNLSGGDIDRAFLSIRSENERRERLFLKYGVSNILGYQEKYRDGECDEPLPHIFIIIDEFAQLKMEEPDFMQDMIAMSRVGRSLGMHLILCTQKPSGSVDGQIISNSGFQIALKLQDPMDSKEVIKIPDAAYLSNPGRAIIRRGRRDVCEIFQAAYSLCPVTKSKRRSAVLADYFGRPIEKMFFEEHMGESSLTYLTNEITLASLKTNIVLKPLWLKELPEELPIEKVLDMMDSSVEENMVPIGIWDDPVTVTGGVYGLNIDEGNVLICGMPYSGKSVFIETFLRSFLARNGDTRKLFIFDWGGGTLIKLSSILKNHIYLTEGDERKAEEVLKELLVKSGDEDIILIIDGIGNLSEQGGFGVQSLFKELLRKSEMLKIRIMVSAYGISGKEVSKSMQGYFKQLISLGQQDSYLYSEVLSEPHFKGKLKLCPGRGYTKRNDKIVEFMTGRY